MSNTHHQQSSCGSPFTFQLLHPRYWLNWIGLGFVWILALMPHQIRHRLGDLIGNITYRKNNKRREVVISNLKIAFPQHKSKQIEQLAQEHLQWYGRALVDYSLLFFASKRRLRKLIEIEGQEYIDKAIEQNKSVMMLLAHSVMLEFGPVTLGLNYHCYGSYKNSKNPLMDWLIARSRCRFVKFVVSREEGLRKLIRELVPQQLLIFLPDEDLGMANAVFAPFFGKDKATLTTPSRIAKLAKADSLPCYVYFNQQTGKYKLLILPAIENYPQKNRQENALKLNRQMEQLISRAPAQYMWLMKWYKTRPEGESEVY